MCRDASEALLRFDTYSQASAKFNRNTGNFQPLLIFDSPNGRRQWPAVESICPHRRQKTQEVLVPLVLVSTSRARGNRAMQYYTTWIRTVKDMRNVGGVGALSTVAVAD